MGLRVTKPEADEIRRRARERGLTVSAFLRHTVLESTNDGDGTTCLEPISHTHSQQANQTSTPGLTHAAPSTAGPSGSGTSRRALRR
jgi:hypothetical protein